MHHAKPRLLLPPPISPRIRKLCELLLGRNTLHPLLPLIRNTPSGPNAAPPFPLLLSGITKRPGRTLDPLDGETNL